MKKTIFFTLISLFYYNLIVSQVPNYLPTNGLIGWWPFDGNANDESGNQNHGQVFGSSLTMDRFGNSDMAYNFNGIDNFILVDNSESISNVPSLSISVWLKKPVGSSVDDYQGIVTKWFFSYFDVCNGGSFDSYTMLIGDNNFISSTNMNTINGNNVNGGTCTADDKWHFLVFTHSPVNGGKMYVNGVLTGEQTTYGDICPSENNLFFGADNFQGNMYRFLSGNLDDVGMWNRDLNEDEVFKLYRDSNSQNPTNTDNPNIVINIDVFPNPTTDVINVDLSGLNDYSGQKLRIMNLSGQIVYEENVNQSKVVIDVKSLLSSGIYVLNTVDRNGTITSTNKFVVQ